MITKDKKLGTDVCGFGRFTGLQEFGKVKGYGCLLLGVFSFFLALNVR